MNSLLRFTSLLAASVIAVTLAASAAVAADFSINPTRVTLDGKKPVDTVTLVSNEDQEISFEVSIFKWSQDAKGEWVEVPTNDLVVYPALMKMPAKGKGLVRVGAKSKEARTVEGSYRLIIQELPGRPLPGDTTAVRLLTRVSLPVFLSPTTPQIDLSLQAEKLSGGAKLTVLNRGNVHLAPQTTTVEFLDASGKSLGAAKPAAPGPAYVLGGATNGWTQEWGSLACSQAASVKVTFETTNKTLTAPLSGSCR